ncbi:hypothetical protein FB471_3119 [Amycolatopsis cihanbeyliensis]|uniref:Uncharacterized protein n=2 Tax=Amycolatopsis cihanbeyliensis TaxID=1128664 RepID=A0A542DJU1_AMYCI|nr:hypothetical protein FB471_3119 [Amycolatopsis cihanbeyliensis]
MPRPPQQDSGALPRPPQQHSGAMPRPPLPHRGRNPAQQPPPAAQQEPPARAPARAQPPPPPPGSLAARLDGLDEAEPEAPEQQPPPPGRMATGGYPVPPGAPPRGRRPMRRAAPQPEPESHTEQFPAVGNAAPGLNGSAVAEPEPDEPPAGLAGWRERRRRTQLDDTEVGAMPAVAPAEAAPADDQDAGPPTQGFVPADDPLDDSGVDAYSPAGLDAFGDPLDDPLREADLHPDEYDYAEDEPLEPAVDGAGEDDFAEVEELAEAEEDEDASPARQWLALAGQLTLGVAGGAGVWLGFNWLWTRLPAAALVAALVVTVGLVLIVRKVRRAEDLQTTVLALLVGLVVTVSPAALLLVSR